jgi:hypothetical protein
VADRGLGLVLFAIASASKNALDETGLNSSFTVKRADICRLIGLRKTFTSTALSSNTLLDFF